MSLGSPEGGPQPDTVELTRAVTHIGLSQANVGKLQALDALSDEFLRVCQIYARRFCTTEAPNGFGELVEVTTLSDRWHRCAVQQAAGIARSWRSNRAWLYEDYLGRLRSFEYHERAGTLFRGRKRPEWREPSVPTLTAVVLRANANVVKDADAKKVVRLEAAEGTTFDFWLQIATLAPRQPILVPVRLSDYHREALSERERNTSVELSRRSGQWWLTVSITERVEPTTSEVSVAVGADVGIANFVTGSDSTQYGSFRGNLAERHKRDREKRTNKSRLRASLKKKAEAARADPAARPPRLPSVENKRLGRHVRQEINRAVNEFLADHVGMILVIELLSVASMRMRSRAMNAYLYASNLGHVLKQLKWKARLRGQQVIEVPSPYSSQECRICHSATRANRPDQRTFRCTVCGHEGVHADIEAALTILSRKDDDELRQASWPEAIKAILDRRHAEWLAQRAARSVAPRPVARPDEGRGSTGVG